MLCRAILTAIAISCTFSREITVHARGQASPRLVQIKDVICVLLLSGLQKEDLDVNTLQKLRRHNVNIYDMNNESLRRECLSKSHSETTQVVEEYQTTEDQNIPINIQIRSEGLNVADVLRSETTSEENKFRDKTDILGTADEIKIEENSQKEKVTNENIKTNDDIKNKQDHVTIAPEGNINQQIEYVNNQPSLGSLIQFWNKLVHRGKSDKVSESITTQRPPLTDNIVTTTPKTIDTDNKDQSKKMEKVNRIISDYLASRAALMTTQTTENFKKMECVSIKEETNSESPLKNIQRNFDENIRLSDLTEFGRAFHINNKYELITEKALSTPRKIANFDVKRRQEIFQTTPEPEFITRRVLDYKEAQKKEALKYIDELLGIKKELINNEPTAENVHKTNASKVERKQFKIMDNAFQLEALKRNSSNGNESVQGKNITTTNDQIKDVSSDIIQKIAEKVKDIVMRDIRKEIHTTDAITSPVTTTSKPSITTSTKATVLTGNSVKPHQLVEDKNMIIKTLIELFKELKTTNETTTPATGQISRVKLNGGNTFVHQPLKQAYPTNIPESNAYGIQAPVVNNEQVARNIYDEKLEVIPLVPAISDIHTNKHVSRPSNLQSNKLAPVAIQTNSAEIPPLAIQISKPPQFMNQLIIVTTPNPCEKQNSKQRIDDQYTEILGVGGENPTYVDLTKKQRTAEQVNNSHRQTYSDKINKLKVRIKSAHDHDRDRSKDLIRLGPGQMHDVSGLVSPTNQAVRRPVEPDNHETLNRPLSSNHRESLNQPEEQSDRDIITREVLSRLVDSNRHDIISRLVNPKTQVAKNVPMDVNHQSRSHHSDAYERIEHERSHPRHKAPKFHEKLERLENRPHHNYNVCDKNGGCGEIPARDQVPLSKIKQRPRFDDSHFRNFLKTQQKVTDMLERILAEKTKPEFRSVEVE